MGGAVASPPYRRYLDRIGNARPGLVQSNRKGMIMKPTKSELEQAVKQGLAYKSGNSYFATPLGKAIQWANENINDASQIPAEGIRLHGCLISKELEDGDWVVNVAEVRQ